MRAVTVEPRPVAEVAGGYEFLRHADVGLRFPFTEDNFPLGAFVSSGWYAADWLALVGEVGWDHGESAIDFWGPGCPPTFPFPRCVPVHVNGTQTFDMHTFLAGLRIFPRIGSVSPFLHILVGAARLNVQAEFDELRGVGRDLYIQRFGETPEDSGRGAAWQIGSGIDVRIGNGLWVRFAGDYRRVDGRTLLSDLDQLRLSSGVVVGFGAR